MIELHDFYNDGSGWVCRHCECELSPKDKPEAKHSRMFREGEAEAVNIRNYQTLPLLNGPIE